MIRKATIGFLSLVLAVAVIGIVAYTVNPYQAAPEPASSVPVFPEPVAETGNVAPPLYIRANGADTWIGQTENVAISWASQANECTLSLEDEAYLVPGSGTQEFRLSFNGDPNKQAVFIIVCQINGKYETDSVSVGGMPK